MALIIRPKTKKRLCHFVDDKDGELKIASAYVSHLPSSCTEYESMDAIGMDRPDVAHALANQKERSMFLEKFANHDLSKIHELKKLAVVEFDNTGNVPDIVSKEAEVRGVGTDEMIEMIREKAFVSTDQINTELARIKAKLALT